MSDKAAVTLGRISEIIGLDDPPMQSTIGGPKNLRYDRIESQIRSVADKATKYDALPPGSNRMSWDWREDDGPPGHETKAINEWQTNDSEAQKTLEDLIRAGKDNNG